MSLAVQIVNYRTKGYLQECLHSVLGDLAGSSVEHDVLVLENGSGDDLTDVADRFGSNVRIHHSPVNRGFGAGHNLLAAQTAAEHLCFVNPDVAFPPACVFERLLACFADREVAVAGPAMVGADGLPQRWDHGELTGLRARIANGAGEAYWRPREEPGPVAWVSGAFMLIRRSVFEWAGGFDERYFLYKEEEDLCLRLRRAGWRVHYEPRIQVTHVGSVVAERRPELFRASVAHYLEKNFRRRWRRRLLHLLYLAWARRG